MMGTLRQESLHRLGSWPVKFLSSANENVFQFLQCFSTKKIFSQFFLSFQLMKKTLLVFFIISNYIIIFLLLVITTNWN